MNGIGGVAFLYIFICSNHPVRLAFGFYLPVLDFPSSCLPLVTYKMLPPTYSCGLNQPFI